MPRTEHDAKAARLRPSQKADCEGPGHQSHETGGLGAGAWVVEPGYGGLGGGHYRSAVSINACSACGQTEVLDDRQGLILLSFALSQWLSRSAL